MISFQNNNTIAVSLLVGTLPNSGAMITANYCTSSIHHVGLLGLVVHGAVRIGNALGARKARRAAFLSRMTVVGTSTISFSSVLMVVAVLIITPYVAAFTPDPEAIRVTVTLVRSLAVVVVPATSFIHGAQFVMR